jgi:hypothetical protein
MLEETIEAVSRYSHILLDIAEGRLNYDSEERVIRNAHGLLEPFATHMFNWSLGIYSRNPPLFNLIEAAHILFHPIETSKIEHYLDRKRS